LKIIDFVHKISVGTHFLVFGSTATCFTFGKDTYRFLHSYVNSRWKLCKICLLWSYKNSMCTPSLNKNKS